MKGVICSDSQAALIALISSSFKSNMVSDCWGKRSYYYYLDWNIYLAFSKADLGNNSNDDKAKNFTLANNIRTYSNEEIYKTVRQISAEIYLIL